MVIVKAWTDDLRDVFNRTKESLANAAIPDEKSLALRKHSKYDRELLAAYSSVKNFCYLLEGRRFTLYTDHKPLTFALQQQQDKASPIQTFRFIAKYTTDICHISGIQTILADTLSRLDSLPFTYALAFL